ncbi:MAG TPA: hypothetical protein VJ746_14605 [Nitrospira sp.]|nr:hypothetical protein [Nitrospira sp.]
MGASAQTLLIPSVSVQETYDSNVFYTPKSLLQPGSKPEDLYTSVIPQLNVAHTSSLIQGSLFAGAAITRYINNPNLDYTGINAGGYVDAKRWADKISQRISALTVRGLYQFTPASTAFAAPSGGLGTGFGSTNITTPVNAGLITNRVSTHVYNLGVTGGYILTPTTNLTGMYTYTRMSFGSQSGGVDNQLFGTTGHQATTTLTTILNRRDSVGTTATLSHYEQEQSSGSGTSSFTTIGGTANWSRTWTQRLNTSLGGGAIFTLPQETGIPGQTIKTQVAPNVSALLTYSSFVEGLRDIGTAADFSSDGPPGPFYGLPTMVGSLSPGGILAPGRILTSFRYTFSVFPSYAIGAGPMKTHVVGANVNGGITSRLSAQAGLNYSHGSASAPLTTFDTVGLTAGARYLIGPFLANLQYNWLYFSTSSSQADQALNQTVSNDTIFSKKMVILSVSAAFNSQAFFRMGGFGNWGAPTATPADGGTTPPDSTGGGAPSGSGAGSLKKE